MCLRKLKLVIEFRVGINILTTLDCSTTFKTPHEFFSLLVAFLTI